MSALFVLPMKNVEIKHGNATHTDFNCFCTRFCNHTENYNYNSICQTSFIRLIKPENLLELFAEINVSDYTDSISHSCSEPCPMKLTYLHPFLHAVYL